MENLKQGYIQHTDTHVPLLSTQPTRTHTSNITFVELGFSSIFCPANLKAKYVCVCVCVEAKVVCTAKQHIQVFLTWKSWPSPGFYNGMINRVVYFLCEDHAETNLQNILQTGLISSLESDSAVLDYFLR